MARIFLIGYMGSGKTTMGRRLSTHLGLKHYDLDQYIENRFHRSIKKMFDEEGEDCFRKREQNILHEIGTFEDVLISTGGGTPCFFNNMEWMNQMGITVFLDVPIKELAARIKLSPGKRPILLGKDNDELEQYITQHLAKRSFYYQQAKLKVNASGMITKNDELRLTNEWIKLIEPWINNK